MKKLLLITILFVGCATPEPLELRARRQAYIKPGTAKWYELSPQRKQEELVKQHKATGLPPKRRGLHVVVRE